MAGTTGLEPAASAVTGQRSNQLNYVPTRQINEVNSRSALECYCAIIQNAIENTSVPEFILTASDRTEKDSRVKSTMPAALSPML